MQIENNDYSNSGFGKSMIGEELLCEGYFIPTCKSVTSLKNVFLNRIHEQFVNLYRAVVMACTTGFIIQIMFFFLELINFKSLRCSRILYSVER
jgi:hypothetical protein